MGFEAHELHVYFPRIINFDLNLFGRKTACFLFCGRELFIELSTDAAKDPSGILVRIRCAGMRGAKNWLLE